jgi:hypothetical protein
MTEQGSREQDELELQPEEIKDLEPDEENANAVRGGPGASGQAGCAAQRTG